MRQLIYQVAIGHSELYEHCIESVAAYCKLYDIDHIVQRSMILNIKPDPFNTNRSVASWDKHNGLVIFEKENALEYLHAYDQVAIIDSDIWIRPNSPNIFESLPSQFEFGAVVENSMPIHQGYRNKIRNYSRMQYSRLSDVDWYWQDNIAHFYNMGMIVMNNTLLDKIGDASPKQFIEQHRFKKFVDGVGPWKWSTDQTLLNYWVKKDGIKVKDMSWKWNSLYSAVEDVYMKQSYFVHFFLKDKLPNKGENVNELMKAIQ